MKFFMFKFNNLQIKPFDEFIIDPLSSILQEQKLLYLSGVIGSRKNQIIKLYKWIFWKKIATWFVKKLQLSLQMHIY